MIWMISANGKMYDHASSFATNGFIDWRQRAKYSVGDTVYIYCTRPFKKVMYKCEVMKHSMPFSQCIDDAIFWIDTDEYEKSKGGLYARLKLLEQVDTERLSLDVLLSKGLKAAPQGPIKVDTDLHKYIDSHFNDFYADGFYTDVDDQKGFHEGHVRSVMVDVYERSSIARGKCIEYHGDSCLICGINFGEKYGDIGKGFIHIQHLRPLYTIRKDYVVNYKDDLIPVCPNCHAMIHRIANGENMSIEQIQQVLSSAVSSHKSSTNNKRVFEQKTPQSHNMLKEKIITQTPSEKANVPHITVGMVVAHKVFGVGTIKEISKDHNHVVIAFDIGEKTFIMPDAFIKGFLNIETSN